MIRTIHVRTAMCALLLSPALHAQSTRPPTPAPPTASAAQGASSRLDTTQAAAATNAEATGVGEHFETIIDRERGLTAKQAGRRAAKTSRQAEVKIEETRHADAAISQTLWGAAPRLTLSARYARLSKVPAASLAAGSSGSLVGTPAAPGLLGPADPLVAIDSSALSFPVLLNNYRLNAGLVVPLSNYLFSTTEAVRGARAARESTVIDQQIARLQSAAEAKLAYYDWVRSRLQLVLAEQSQRHAVERAATMSRLFQAGRAAQADVLQAQAFSAQSELVVLQVKTAATISEERLRMLMHSDPKETLTIGEQVLEPQPVRPKENTEELYREGITKRLEIRALDKTAYALTQAVVVQDAGAYPKLEMFGNLTYSNPNQRIFPQQDEFRTTWDIGIQASWNVTDLGMARANAMSSSAQRAQVIAQRRSIEDALRLEIVVAQQGQAEARLATKTARTAEQAAQAAYRARELLFQHGRSTSLEVMQAQTMRFQARLDLINAHIALRVADVKLNHATGRDNDGSAQ